MANISTFLFHEQLEQKFSIGKTGITRENGKKTNSIHSSGSVPRERQGASSSRSNGLWTLWPWTKRNFRPPCSLQKTAKSPQKGCNDPRQEGRGTKWPSSASGPVADSCSRYRIHRFWQGGKEVTTTVTVDFLLLRHTTPLFSQILTRIYTSQIYNASFKIHRNEKIKYGQKER